MTEASGTTCDFECAPRDDLEWVPNERKGTSIDSRTGPCRREPLDGHDRCAFHIPPEERPADVSPGERLRDRLQIFTESAIGDDERYTNFRGAYFDEIDLSELELDALQKDVTLDFSYAHVEEGVTLSNADVPATVAFKFASVGSLTAERATIRELDCSGTWFRDDAPTKSVGTNNAVELTDESEIQTASFAGATADGRVLISALTARNTVKCGYLRVTDDLQLSGVTTRALVFDDVSVDGSVFVEAVTVDELSADDLDADSITLRKVDATDRVSIDDATADDARLIQVETAELSIQPPQIARLELNRVGTRGRCDLAVDVDAGAELSVLTVRNCRFESAAAFDRLSLQRCIFEDTTFAAGGSFSGCEIADATFTSEEGPLFGGSTTFDAATLPGSTFESEGATVDGEITFRNAELRGASLNEFGATNGADFTLCDLTEASLLNADLSHARLEGALLNRARLIGADLSGAYLYQATLGNASIDTSTSFGLPLVYDTRSSYPYDEDSGFDSEAGPADKAMEAYMSIHNATRTSGQSDVAIESYIKRQEVRTDKLRGNSLSEFATWFGWRLYGAVTRYGVGVQRLVGISALIILAGIVLVTLSAGIATTSPLDTVAYPLAGFVGVTLPYETSTFVEYVLTAEAVFGAVLIALFVNALGRRSSM